ncbi:MAG: hypothetical protein LH481_09605, partial [Burkholderiales bacterium]|nr:hypothetical protein [Burkholderiales bacterium]
TEKSIQAELRDIARDRTTLVIAHRLSTIIDADQILVMDLGRIVERGNFRELIEQNGSSQRCGACSSRKRRRQFSASRRLVYFGRNCHETPMPARLLAYLVL